MTNNTKTTRQDETKGPAAKNVTTNGNDNEANNKTAKQHEEAAKHHLEAAKHFKAGNAEKANASSMKANEQHAQLGKSAK